MIVKYILLITILVESGAWLADEGVKFVRDEFQRYEDAIEKKKVKVDSRTWSYPFISGDGFRQACPHVCDETNRCRMWPERVSNGSCIFVKADLYHFFAHHVIPRIPGTYVVVSHNGDLSTPDGQTDAPRIRMQTYRTEQILQREYRKGRLLGHHGTNLWWRESRKNQNRPP
jgi:hypothetical protein